MEKPFQLEKMSILGGRGKQELAIESSNMQDEF